MKETVLFIPGYMEQQSSRNYSATIRALTEKGYAVKFVPITWKHRTAKHWLEEFNQVYKEYDASTTVLAGFSFGAVIALMAAAQKNPAELWLFSLSPYFAEDFPISQSWSERIGNRRTENFKKLSFNTLAKDIRCKTIAWVGEDEVEKFPTLGSRADSVKSKILYSTLVRVKNTGHDVTDPNYVESIKSEI